MTNLYELGEHCGNIDIYLFDQLLKRRITPGMTVVDTGCGYGRNIHYLLRAGHPVFAIDSDATAIEAVRELAGKVAPHLPPTNFRIERLEHHTLPEALAELVICSAVLHFATDETHFSAMIDGAWRTLQPGGIFFARLASTIGVETLMTRLQERRYRLPDGSERFLVDAPFLKHAEARIGAERMDPLKTTIVQDQRAMTTWVLRKPE